MALNTIPSKQIFAIIFVNGGGDVSRRVIGTLQGLSLLLYLSVFQIYIHYLVCSLKGSMGLSKGGVCVKKKLNWGVTGTHTGWYLPGADSPSWALASQGPALFWAPRPQSPLAILIHRSAQRNDTDTQSKDRSFLSPFQSPPARWFQPLP